LILPEKERLIFQKSFALSQIKVCYGGRAAEKIFTKEKEVSSGSENDLQRATHIAKKMICSWGMSSSVGPVSYAEGSAGDYISSGSMKSHDCSEETNKKIDQEVRKILTDAEDTAVKILEKHKNKVIQLTKALLKKETLEKKDIDKILPRN